MSDTELDDLRKEVVRAGKTLFDRCILENNEGNVSVRVGRKDELLITPTANQYDTLTPDQVVHVDFDGNLLSSGKLPSTELKMHTAIYKSRRKVKCVIHTHSTFATMLSIVRKRIPIIMEEQIIYLGGAIEISDFGKAHTEEIGNVALDALGINNAALLANHGSIIVGKSVQSAVKAAELTEKLSRIYWGTLQIGEPVIVPEEFRAEHSKMFDMLFASYPKRLKK